jgi:putative hydrolase of the HAD superfamily
LIRAVLFDAAGTLIAPREPAGETYSRLAREHGVELSAWRLGDALRRILAQAPPMVFPGQPQQDVPGLERGWWRRVVRDTFRAADSARRFPDFEAFFEALWLRFADPGAWTPRPGARALLERLHAAGLRTSVVSNFDHRLPALLQGLSLAAWLDDVVIPARAGVAKPDPGIFRFALERLGAAPGEALFVGDDAVRDLRAARDLGIAAIDATTLATLEDLRLPEAVEGRT